MCDVRYPHIVEDRIRAILTATALTYDAAVIEPNRLLVEALVEQLRALLRLAIARDPYVQLPALFSCLQGCANRRHPLSPHRTHDDVLTESLVEFVVVQ